MLESINKVAGCEIEITVRGPESFTFSTDHVNKEASKKLQDFFSEVATVKVEHDQECGSFLYVDFLESKVGEQNVDC